MRCRAAERCRYGNAARTGFVAELVAYLADEVLPHALAEEHTIYRVASARVELSDTVAEMIAEHRSLASATERLADVRIGDVAKAQAQEIAALFAAHVAKENDILLPVLVADEEVDLAQLLIQMHRLTEAGRARDPADRRCHGLRSRGCGAIAAARGGKRSVPCRPRRPSLPAHRVGVGGVAHAEARPGRQSHRCAAPAGADGHR